MWCGTSIKFLDPSNSQRAAIKKPSQLVSSCEGLGSFKDYLIIPIILPWLSQAQPKDFCLLITLSITWGSQSSWINKDGIK